MALGCFGLLWAAFGCSGLLWVALGGFGLLWVTRVPGIYTTTYFGLNRVPWRYIISDRAIRSVYETFLAGAFSFDLQIMFFVVSCFHVLFLQ